MTAWEPDPDGVLVDGCRVRIGDGPHEGTWRPFHLGTVHVGMVGIAYVPLGCPVTVLREVRPLVETTLTIRLPVGRDDAILGDIADSVFLFAGCRGIDACVASETLPVPADPDADR